MYIVTSAEMAAAEAWCVEHGTPVQLLMDRAGAAVAEAARAMVGRAEGRIVVLAGPGNNGGDGLVAAGRLHRAGFQVNVGLAPRRADPDLPRAAAEAAGVRLLDVEVDA